MHPADIRASIVRCEGELEKVAVKLRQLESHRDLEAGLRAIHHPDARFVEGAGAEYETLACKHADLAGEIVALKRAADYVEAKRLHAQLQTASDRANKARLALADFADSAQIENRIALARLRYQAGMGDDGFPTLTPAQQVRYDEYQREKAVSNTLAADVTNIEAALAVVVARTPAISAVLALAESAVTTR